MTLERALLLLAVIAAISLFYLFGLHRYLTLDAIKAQRDDIAALYAARPALVIAAFMAIHIAALALSLPGAVLAPTLAAGAIFGPVWGVIFALGAIVAGDSLGFLIARYLLRDWVEARFATQAAAIARGVDAEGAFYLLALRLMAIVPFFVVNLTMGLTRMKLGVFAPVSLIGLIPATILYAYAGTTLAAIDSPSDIYSPRLIAAFILLGLLPIAARRVFARVLRKH